MGVPRWIFIDQEQAVDQDHVVVDDESAYLKMVRRAQRRSVTGRLGLRPPPETGQKVHVCEVRKVPYVICISVST